MFTQYNSNRQREKWIRRYAVGVPIILGVYLILILFYIYPHLPIDIVGWFVLILIGIPISLTLEWIGESILSEKVGLKISGKKVSGKRVIFLLCIFIFVLGILALLWFIFGSFIRHHFR